MKYMSGESRPSGKPAAIAPERDEARSGTPTPTRRAPSARPGQGRADRRSVIRSPTRRARGGVADRQSDRSRPAATPRTWRPRARSISASWRSVSPMSSSPPGAPASGTASISKPWARPSGPSRRLGGQVDRQRRAGRCVNGLAETRRDRRRQAHRQEAVAEAVLVEDVAEAQGDDRPDPRPARAPNRTLARRAAREVLGRHEDLRLPKAWRFRTNSGVLGAVRPDRAGRGSRTGRSRRLRGLRRKPRRDHAVRCRRSAGPARARDGRQAGEEAVIARAASGGRRRERRASARPARDRRRRPSRELMRCVRARPLPALEVPVGGRRARARPGCARSPFMRDAHRAAGARATRSPASRKTRSRPSASAGAPDQPRAGTTIAGTPAATRDRARSPPAARRSSSAAVRARPDEHAVDRDRLERSAGRQAHVREARSRLRAGRIAHRHGSGDAIPDGLAVLGARAPGHDRRDGGGVDATSRSSCASASDGEPRQLVERARPARRPRRRRPAREVRERRLVGRHHAVRAPRLDRHVAEGHAGFHRQRADRRAGVLQRVSGAPAGADGGDQVEARGRFAPTPGPSRPSIQTRRARAAAARWSGWPARARPRRRRCRTRGRRSRRASRCGSRRTQRETGAASAPAQARSRGRCPGADPRAPGREAPLPERSAPSSATRPLGSRAHGTARPPRSGVVVGDGNREVRPAGRGRPAWEHLEGVERPLVDEVAVDVEEVAAAGVRRHDVPRPDLLEHRPSRHREAIVRQSRTERSRP